jgi:sugar lactone lactonase YvrE
MSSYRGTVATDPVYELAEGIVWDDRARLVRWVDIWKGRVLSGAMTDGRIDDIRVLELGQTTGAVALAEDGGLLVAGSRGLIAVSAGGDISFGPDLLGDRRDVRFNDGRVDPQGRFLVGTMALGDPTGDEVLLRVHAEGEVEVLREGLGLSNGIGFSPDGATVYHVDTGPGTVSRHSYGAGSFDHSEPWVTVLTDLPGSPDGLVVDAEGALWVALWGGSSVRRHAPTGKLLDIVEVDAAQASCPGFVGAKLDILAITTAQEGIDEVTDQAGAIFLADVGATGLPPLRWAGSTTEPYWLGTDTGGPRTRADGEEGVHA